ncbi:hypothetical protein QF034_003185 [Streptomyces africanus]|uniref:DUF5134 domain-containing protein n=1 Tax=Streptomyces africanus TaxID=231024 RepID=A0ABU0QNJ1_9ACTN|nr:DUF5134 domain-containing protein [Streptomyces africanus]MDQ0748954.1 hypothetical protein [Streptomyces africanus]
MGSPALNGTLAAVAALVAVVSAARLAAADSREARFAAGGDLVMAGGMAAMFLPATAAGFGDHGLWWVAAFTAVGLGGVALSVQHARLHGWRHGRRWTHHIIGSAAMVIMTLAMPGTDSAPVLALGGHSMAGMDHGHASGTVGTAGMAGMEGTGHSSGATAHDMTTGAAHGSPPGDSASVWRVALIALAVYFLLSIVAPVRARLRGTDRRAGAGRAAGKGRWARRLLALPDAIVVFAASLAISVWDKARPGGDQRRAHAAAGNRSRRRPPGTSPGAALTAHIGMGGTMCAMLVMMAA